MEETVYTTSLDDEPICVCGYSKVGLPEADHPCPECGSTKLAVYKPSFSYTGWRLAEVGTPFALLQLFLMCFESHVPWLFFAMPLGVLSLLFTVISIRKREPKRRSRRNVVRALFLILFYPAALVFISLFVMSQGG
jgi:hypothetical protein